MANEGAPNPNDGGKPGGDPNPNPNPNPSPNPTPAPGAGDGKKPVEGDAWAKEKAGLVGDLGKERTARQKEAAARAALEKQVEDLNKKIQVLAGANPKSDDESEIEEIKARFSKVFENLSKLNDPETYKKIEKLLGMVPTLDRTVEHYWGKHGTDVLTQIEKAVAKELGDAGELTPTQIKQIRAAYIIEAENNPEFAKLHEDNPTKAVESFTKDWIDSWIEPGRRKAQADEIARRPRVPSAKDRNLVTGAGGKDIDVNDPKAVEDALVSGFKARGGQFGRDR